MKNESFIEELESLCEQAGYHVRKERGSFRGDSCIIEGDKLIVVNKNRPLESQIGILARVLRNSALEEVYVKPVVRKKLRELWDRIDRMQQEEIEVFNEDHSE